MNLLRRFGWVLLLLPIVYAAGFIWPQPQAEKRLAATSFLGTPTPAPPKIVRPPAPKPTTRVIVRPAPEPKVIVKPAPRTVVVREPQRTVVVRPQPTVVHRAPQTVVHAPRETRVLHPSAICSGVTAGHATDTMWRFTANAKATDTQIQGYRWTFSDQGQATTTANYIDKPATNRPVTVHAQVLTNEYESPISEQCSATIGQTVAPVAAQGPVTMTAPAPAAVAAGPPELRCDAVTVSNATATMWRFTAQARAANTQIEGYRWTFSDQGQATTTANYIEKVMTRNPVRVQVQVLGSDGQVTPMSEQCSVSTSGTGASPVPTRSGAPGPSPTVQGFATYSPAPINPAGKGAETLPDTGPEVVVGGAIGLGILGFAGRVYMRSRRSLMDSLRRR